MRFVVLIQVALLVTTGCATESGNPFVQGEAQSVETQLRFAGFHLLAADTPQRIESMRSMPPLVFSRVFRGDQQFFVYADPVSCLCLWAGTPANYERFLQLSAEAEVSTEQAIAQDIAFQAELWDPEWGTIDDPMDPVTDPDL